MCRHRSHKVKAVSGCTNSCTGTGDSMADTKRRRQRKSVKRKGRQRKSVARSKRRVLKWNSRSRRGVFLRPAAKGRGKPPAKPPATGTPPGPARAAPAKSVKAEKPVDDVWAPAKAAVAAKAVHKTPPKSQEKPDGVKKATSQPSQIRDARQQQKSEPPNRTSGSVHKETSQKEPQKQVKKAAPAKKAKG